MSVAPSFPAAVSADQFYGWDTHVVPNPLLTGKDWEASVGLSLTGSVTNVQTKPYIDKGDPYNKLNPAQKVNPAAVTVTKPSTPAASQQLHTTVTPGAAQMLNPQPLPPKAIQQK